MVLVCRLCCIAGSATLIAVVSSMIIDSARHIAPTAHQRRLVCALSREPLSSPSTTLPPPTGDPSRTSRYVPRSTRELPREHCDAAISFKPYSSTSLQLNARGAPSQPLRPGIITAKADLG